MLRNITIKNWYITNWYITMIATIDFYFYWIFVLFLYCFYDFGYFSQILPLTNSLRILIASMLCSGTLNKFLIMASSRKRMV